MPNKEFTIEDGGKIISELALIDAKEVALISKHDDLIAKQEAIKKEIKRIEKLQSDADEMRAEASNIKGELKSLEEKRSSKNKMLTDNGWVVPIPERKLQASSVRL